MILTFTPTPQTLCKKSKKADGSRNNKGTPPEELVETLKDKLSPSQINAIVKTGTYVRVRTPTCGTWSSIHSAAHPQPSLTPLTEPKTTHLSQPMSACTTSAATLR